MRLVIYGLWRGRNYICSFLGMVIQITSNWQVPQGGAGNSVMNFDDDSPFDQAAADELVDAVGDFWDTFVSRFPIGVTVTVDPLVVQLGAANGVLDETWTATPHAATTGSNNQASSAAGVGCRVRWNTQGIRNGRRVIGTTFIVPLSADQYEVNGTLGSTTISGITTAAEALLGRANAASHAMVVWSRPTPGVGTNGFVSPVTGALVPDKVAWLRTRKQ